jgi:hypothetical protein
LLDFGVEERMSWAAARRTKREEDEAYSLLGIFGVSMPLIYSEGRERAMKRLKKAIEETIEGTASVQLKLLSSLQFDRIDSRQAAIKDAHKNTCTWLLRKPEYLDWNDPSKMGQHHGFLWIKGKPGTGKSTIMKYAHHHILHNTEEFVNDPIVRADGKGLVVAFFFNARGEAFERSTLGMYRSLLFQILDRRPPLRWVLGLVTPTMSELNAGYVWTVEVLQLLLKSAIRSIKEPMTCFLDALDECEERQIRDMISFFEQVVDLTFSAGIRVQICFASRHYPHISIKKGLELDLDGQEGHAQDITKYLETELRIGQSRFAQQVQQELQSKASGVFMWVVLAVDILNKEYDSGRVHSLRRRLQEIPADLHELLGDILTRDTHNKDDLVLCIQWILFSAQPMSPEALYFAILFESEPDALVDWNREEITLDTMKRFILDSSKGLAEITKSDRPKVQFIHESVRDIILKGDVLGTIWPELRLDFEGYSKRRLHQCCLRYMFLGTLSQVKGLERRQMWPSQITSSYDILTIRFPPFLSTP